MEAAKSFVANHTSRRGHTTDVEEFVQPAVTWEKVYPTRHEVTTSAVDREVHQHHYHTTVQPLSHTVSLPTKHTHNLIAAKKVHHQKDDVEATNRRLAADAAMFKNVSVTLPTTHSAKQMPTVIGTHYHHHVHEVVQPIIHKEVLTTEVVHTTIPIHERHLNKAEHHGLSELPLKTMTEFSALEAAPRGFQTYEGPPRPYESALHTSFDKLGLGSKQTSTPVAGSGSRLAVKTHTSTHTHTQTQTHSIQRPNRRRSGSSSSSLSSLSSLDDPKTPTRSPRHSSKPFTSNHVMPIKTNEANKPVRILDSESPRLSNESTGSGRHGFMSRLTGRV